MGKTKLDSIDKVVDLIRTVSRDISPESSKYCECYNEFYQEKENQTDDEMCQSIDISHEYARKIELQQTEIELLNAELDRKVSNCDIESSLLLNYLFFFSLFCTGLTFTSFISQLSARENITKSLPQKIAKYISQNVIKTY